MTEQELKNYYVYNKTTGELESYPQVAAQPGFNVNAEVLFDPAGNRYVGSELQAAINANRGGGGVFGSISRELTNIYQPVEKAISTNLAQLDKDLSLSQNAPLIATIAASVALPGVGASIGNSLLS